MANPNAVLATVYRLDPPLEGPAGEALRAASGLWVEVEGQRRLRLDPEDSRAAGFAEVIDGLRRNRLPAYIEFEPEAFTVTGVRVPYVSPVLGFRTVARGVLDVVLAISHARTSCGRAPRTMRRSAPCSTRRSRRRPRSSSSTTTPRRSSTSVSSRPGPTSRARRSLSPRRGRRGRGAGSSTYASSCDGPGGGTGGRGGGSAASRASAPSRSSTTCRPRAARR